MPGKNITGNKYGKLTAVRSTGVKSGNGDFIWECSCACGNTCKTTIGRLNYGHTRSCGCLLSENCASRSHGKSKGCKAYTSWRKIKERLLMKSNKAYYNQYSRSLSGGQDCDDDEYGEVLHMSNGTPRMFRKHFTVNSFDYYFDGEVGEPKEYRDLIHVLHSASQTDSIRLWIDTNGGNLDATIAIIDAMQNTEAEITVIVTGRAYSAGSLLAMAGMKYGQLVISERARFMIHSGSFGSGGKESEVEEHTRATLDLVRELKKEFYSGFLTDDEMKLLDIGKDYYFNAKAAAKRIKNRIEYLESKEKPKAVTKPKPKKKVIPKPEYNPEDVAFKQQDK